MQRSGDQAIVLSWLVGPTNVKSCLVEHITERGALYEDRAVTRAPGKPYVVLSNQQAVPSGTRAVCRDGRLVNLSRVWFEVRRLLHPAGSIDWSAESAFAHALARLWTKAGQERSSRSAVSGAAPPWVCT